MRTQYVTVTYPATNSDPIILDNALDAWECSVKLDELVDGATVKIQYSLDDPTRCTGISGNPLADITPVWHDHATETGKTASTTPVAISIPCTMFRVVITSGSAGSFRLAVLQHG